MTVCSAVGEPAASARITYRVPDFSDASVAARYRGKHVVVAGTGVSAKTARVIGLFASLRTTTRPGSAGWSGDPSVGQSFGGGDADQLEKRGELGKVAQAAVEAGPVRTVTEFRAARVTDEADGLSVWLVDRQVVEAVDEIIVLTGFRARSRDADEIRLSPRPERCRRPLRWPR